MPDPELVPAPARGRYDRALSRERRQAHQHERLLCATAASFRSRQTTVTGVVELAGVGRNTFYEYFDDYAHALEAVRARALARVTLACDGVLEPGGSAREKVRAVCAAFCESVLASTDEALVLLCVERSPEKPLSSAGQALEEALFRAFAQRQADASQASSNVQVARPPSHPSTLAVAAAAEALLLKALAHTLAHGREAEEPTAAIAAFAAQVLT